MIATQRIARARIVDEVLFPIHFDEAVVSMRIETHHAQHRALRIALAGVVVDHVEDHRDAVLAV